MATKLDYINKRFTRLIVIRKEDSDKFGHSRWLCKCDCGKDIIVIGDNLKRGNTKSCGCLWEDKMTKHGCATKIRHPLYYTWQNMKQRCYNPKYKQYKDYGGRGIKICEEWINDSNAFIQWGMNNKWQANLEIDRINNNGNYSPDNCRFTTHLENMKNRRNVQK